MIPERVVLVGFMGSGKSRVGRELASRLGWRHVDLDREIESREGVTIAEYFARHGEQAFRALETRITPEFTGDPRLVVSTGGGWVTNPGVFESLPPATLSVYLRVSRDEVLRRVARGSGRATRPLLSTPDPAATVDDLLKAREPLYRRADMSIDTDRRSPWEVAEEIYRAMMSENVPTDLNERGA